MSETTDKEPMPREFMTVMVAALLFANADDLTDGAMFRAFARAEQFVAEAERRYGSLTDAC